MEDNKTEDKELPFISKNEKRVGRGFFGTITLTNFIVGGLKGYSDANGLEMSTLGTLSLPFIEGAFLQGWTEYGFWKWGRYDDEVRKELEKGYVFPLTDPIRRVYPFIDGAIIGFAVLGIGYGIGYAAGKLS